MKTPKKDDDKFSPKEAQHRFEAALRGARLTGPKQMKDISPKRKPSTKKPRKKRN